MSLHREARENEQREEYERNNPKIQQQFADLKRALGTGRGHARKPSNGKKFYEGLALIDDGIEDDRRAGS